MARIDELKAKIEEASKAYGEANPIMSDKEFDQLVNELKTLDPTYVDTVTYDDHTEGFPKAKHDLITGTLSKCKNEEEFKEWFRKHPGVYVMEQKMDGAGIELKFRNGKLVQAVTRGTGFEGDDITENAKLVKGVNSTLNLPMDCSIRGEILMSHSMFNKNYKDKMKNCRNAAAGIMKHLDGSELDNLNFVAYDMQEVGEKTIKTEVQKLEFLSGNGFEIPEHTVVKNLTEAFAFRTSQYNNRENIEYDIDGVVVKPEVIDYEDLKNRTPKNSCAIKFELDVGISHIRNIIWSQSGKYFAPVVEIDPIELCGVTVTHAQVFNINKMIELGIEIGKTVEVVRRGEIIPHVEKCY